MEQTYINRADASIEGGRRATMCYRRNSHPSIRHSPGNDTRLDDVQFGIRSIAEAIESELRTPADGILDAQQRTPPEG